MDGLWSAVGVCWVQHLHGGFPLLASPCAEEEQALGGAPLRLYVGVYVRVSIVTKKRAWRVALEDAKSG